MSKRNNSWIDALKEWNSRHNKGSFCVPKKGTVDHAAVKEIQDRIKTKKSMTEEKQNLLQKKIKSGALGFKPTKTKKDLSEEKQNLLQKKIKSGALDFKPAPKKKGLTAEQMEQLAAKIAQKEKLKTKIKISKEIQETYFALTGKHLRDLDNATAKREIVKVTNFLNKQLVKKKK
jgi:hypothetical protein